MAGFLAMNDEHRRLLLTRRYSRGKRTVTWVMLNPSCATERVDDPTMRRVDAFSVPSFDQALVVNLFARRGADPDVLAKSLLDAPELAREIIGEHNDAAIVLAARAADLIVVAWGAHKLATLRSAHVLSLLRGVAPRLYCLGLTTDGAPRHPLFVKRDAHFVPYDPPASPPRSSH